MKNKFLLILLLFFTICVNAQVKTKFNNSDLILLEGKYKKKYKESIVDINIPSDQKIKAMEKADSLLNDLLKRNKHLQRD